MSATCQCKDPVITWGGPEKRTPFCNACLLRVEVVPAYEPDPPRWQDRKFVRKDANK